MAHVSVSTHAGYRTRARRPDGATAPEARARVVDPLARRAGVSGLVLAGTLLPAIATELAGPDSRASVHAVVAGFSANRTDLLASSVLFLLAMCAAFAFVNLVAAIAVQSDASPMLARIASTAGFIGIALLTVYASGLAAIAASIEELRENEHVVYALYRLLAATDDAAGLFVAFFVGASAAILRRAGLTPRWLSRIGVAAAALRAVGALDVTTLGGLPFAPFLVAGTALALAWLVLSCAALYRRAR